jgi:hypothetical protein
LDLDETLEPVVSQREAVALRRADFVRAAENVLMPLIERYVGMWSETVDPVSGRPYVRIDRDAGPTGATVWSSRVVLLDDWSFELSVSTDGFLLIRTKTPAKQQDRLCHAVREPSGSGKSGVMFLYRDKHGNERGESLLLVLADFFRTAAKQLTSS